MTVTALVLLAATGCRVNGKADSMGSSRKSAEAGQVLQGQPMESPPQPFKSARRELPEEADLEAMSQSAPPPKVKDGHQALTFERLSNFEYPLNLDGSVGQLEDGGRPKMPNEIQSLDQSEVSISGYMMPLDFGQAEVSFFILNSNQLQCCYGQEPQINEYCVVMMREPTEVHLDKPVTVSGSLSVGEYTEGGMLICLYRLSGVSVELMDD